MPLKRESGFTLAELLICLMIIGEIATFTIPKVLNSTQNGQYGAIAKEAAGMISQAYFAYQQANGGPSTAMKNVDLTPYMNYVKYDTSTTMDGNYGQTTQSCSSTTCVLLHNGALVAFWRPTASFGGSGTTNMVIFDVDPDGKVTDGTTNGPGKSVEFLLYYNGRLTTWQQMATGSTNTGGLYPTCSNCDPPWFSWN